MLWAATVVLGIAIAQGRHVVLGDLHGDLDVTLRVLNEWGVDFLKDPELSAPDSWTSADKTKERVTRTVSAITDGSLPVYTESHDLTIVQLGDIADRGDHCALIYAALDLVDQHPQIHVKKVLGNHEVMGMVGQAYPEYSSSYAGMITEIDLSDFGFTGNNLQEARLARKEFFSDAAMTEVPIVLLDNRVLYSHASVTLEIATDYPDVDELNWMASLDIEGVIAGNLHYQDSDLLGAYGPTWSREYASNKRAKAVVDENVICDRALKVLGIYGAEYMVMGHTPQLKGKGITRKCNGRVLHIDTGNSDWFRIGVHGGLTGRMISYLEVLEEGRLRFCNMPEIGDSFVCVDEDKLAPEADVNTGMCVLPNKIKNKRKKKGKKLRAPDLATVPVLEPIESTATSIDQLPDVFPARVTPVPPKHPPPSHKSPALAPRNTLGPLQSLQDMQNSRIDDLLRNPLEQSSRAQLPALQVK